MSSQPPFGLVAGWGSFPIEVARAIKQDGGRVFCIAINGHASCELESICDGVKWSGVGRMGSHMRFFRAAGVRQVTMAGKLFKAELLYRGSVWLRHFPDITCLRAFGPLLFGSRRDARDDQLLLAVTRAYERAKLEICPATDFAPELLVNHGTLVGGKLSRRHMRDAQIGWEVAKQMGGLDVGQSITVKDGAVIAVEAIEGTDQCIERTGQLCGNGGWTLVKVSKPNQDMRFDVPTIGPQTIERVSQAGGKAIVIEADKTIVVSREQTLADARRAGISIVAMNDNDLGGGSTESHAKYPIAPAA